jgi:hypothetical protein
MGAIGMTDDYSRNSAPVYDGEILPFHSKAVQTIKDAWFHRSRIASAFKYLSDNTIHQLRNGSLSRKTVEDVYERADKMLCKNLSPLQTRYFVEKGREGASYEACHVIMLPTETESSYREPFSQLHSLRLFISPNRVETECLPLPLAFRLHAVARMMERFDSSINAVNQIGRDICHSTAMLQMAEKTSTDYIDNVMVLPSQGEGGVLIGRYRPDYALIEGTRTTVTKEGVHHEAVNRNPLEASLFEVTTYYGGLVTKPEHKMMRDDLKAWEEANKETCMQVAADVLWPHRRLKPARPRVFNHDAGDILDKLLTTPEREDYLTNLSWDKSTVRKQAAQLSRQMNSFQA